MRINKFSEDVKKALDYYVYILKDADGKIYYVGQGHGDRVLNHKNGDPYIIAYGLGKQQALAVEAILIDLLRDIKQLPKLRNRRGGDKNAIEWKVGQFPAAEVEEQLRKTHYALVLNVTNSCKQCKTLYDAVKGDWALDQWKAAHADYVLAERQGKVVGVFKAKVWHKCNGSKKYWFEGEEVTDPEVLQKCMSIDVSRSRGEANSVRYFYL